MKMKISPEHAQCLLNTIEHKSCQRGVQTLWNTTAAGEATASSYLWLFCWAKTGMNSKKAKEAAVETFNEIFEINFDVAAGEIDHEWARRMRYVPDLSDYELMEHLRL